ncbi:type II toxin-antitoxin system PemK/MazF family toxin [Nostoc sp. WHI]|uniref:type II toxin-antitoxin system PemK/MazF family toxin n=1 Tax=Nostoc sp. WHI TaxID=2650611 RepID=UPI002ED7E063
MGSEPGYRRPVLIIQDDIFTQSRIRTVIVVINSNDITVEAIHELPLRRFGSKNKTKLYQL